MPALTVQEATELGRIFNVNGTGPDVVRKLAIQYRHLTGTQITNSASQWDRLKAKDVAAAVTETAPAYASVSTGIVGDKMRQANALLESANRAESHDDLASASISDLYALAALHYPHR